MTRRARESAEAQRVITVCSECYRASCWQGRWMCEEARSAGTVRASEARLRELGFEHPDHWLTDREIANGVEPGRQVR